MRIRAIHIFLALATYTQTSLAQPQLSLPESLYHAYAGDYFFEDGTYISGGPMDEVPGSLVFLEPMDGTLGGLFEPKTKTLFSSLLPGDPTQIKFDRKSSGEVVGLWWIRGEEKSYAEKKTSPTIETITFRSGDIKLNGELYLPPGDGPFPLIINVHGSGRQTRHIGPWNTFFARYEIAVLSYDKRGAGESTGDFSTAGYPDFADDVVAAVAFAKDHPEIDPEQIGLHGSSEGGWVASIAASKLPELAFMIVRVGSGVSGSDTYMHEVKIELKEKDLTPEQYTAAVRFERTIQDMAANNRSLEEINAYISEFRQAHDWYLKAFGDYRKMSPNYYVKLKKSGPIDPVDYLRKIDNIPILWFLAEYDENVPYDLSKPRILDALAEAGNQDYELITIPKARHNFLVETEDGKMKYADGYWDKMLDWLTDRDIAQPVSAK